jgi:hypothetical protein
MQVPLRQTNHELMSKFPQRVEKLGEICRGATVATGVGLGALASKQILIVGGGEDGNNVACASTSRDRLWPSIRLPT